MKISISVVSHGQSELVKPLLADLAVLADGYDLEVIVTNNIPDTPVENLPPGLLGSIITNSTPLGFGENHNNALRGAVGEIFCILNPDIRIYEDPFPVLLEQVSNSAVGLAAPAILSPDGEVEDSARCFPTPTELVWRFLGLQKAKYAYTKGDAPIEVDFLAGMFLVTTGAAFKQLGGFDERYFLYYEDVDLSARFWRAGYRVMLCPSASAIHAARRDSRSNLRYLRWHLESSALYFVRWWLRSPRRSPRKA